jgi:hypothetical protein
MQGIFTAPAPSYFLTSLLFTVLIELGAGSSFGWIEVIKVLKKVYLVPRNEENNARKRKRSAARGKITRTRQK